MHLLITSASVWANHKQACLCITERLLANALVSAQTLVIDSATARREVDRTSSEPSKTALPMRSWIDHFFRDQPVLDVERVHRDARAICQSGHSIEVIDATALNVDLIDRAMNQLRIAFYGSDRWPEALVLVVDDALLYDVAGFVGRVFFIQPAVTGQDGVNSLLKNLKWFSKLEGFFGLRHSFLNKMVGRVTRPRGRIAVTEER